MSDKIVTRTRSWIVNSGLSEGDRLPPERSLCTELGVTRSELRKSLLLLESEGLLTRHVGRGTYLARLPKGAGSAGIEAAIAALSESTGPIEAMAARLALEPETAALAALHATPAQMRELRRLCQAMPVASSWASYENLDSRFHETIAEASGNALLQAMHRILNGVRLVVVWRRLETPDRGPESDYHSFAEHDAILAAIERRKPDEARSAMLRHINSTLNTMMARRDRDFSYRPSD
ncbi:FCD domain-containing protein [Citreicella sp. C3M06]|uniref:FadR/GntR family transcriptional regulator n=1 Tax=Roseobacteraceae TaxID=2854170 RepID=UPI001C0817EB|nr:MULTISPECIES: FCD domain-containing protein [Roseobacteraceae]MBU2959266.1 FCD domain-containing protein [Citreicella sp. C3M06]MDO6585203.1 FCD domain-containing protein [Salipiger sp. 1_MG-2023]